MHRADSLPALRFWARLSTSTVENGAQKEERARRTTTVDLAGLRVAGGLMLAAAAVRPLVPGEPGLPCPLRLATGIRCPLCGMTTSVTAAAHLDVAEAVAANPMGVVAVAGALALLMAPRLSRLDLPRWVLPATLAAMWAFQLQRFSIV